MKAVTDFLKCVGPFEGLDLSRLQALAARLEHLQVGPGTLILRQGDPGDACYLLRAGSVEVFECTASGSERVMTRLGSGSLFGEAALLTDSPRNASVRAIDVCELFVLKKSDLLETLQKDPNLNGALFEILSLRDRPRRKEGVTFQDDCTSDEVPLTVLKDPERGTYFRLSPEGFFVWQLLDGHHNLKDLVMESFKKFGKFSPAAIGDTTAGLVASGFAESRIAAVGDRLRESQATLWRKILGRTRGFLEWRWVFRKSDPWITRLYRKGVCLLYTWPGQILLASIALSGGVAFCLSPVQFQGLPFLLLIPWGLFSLVLHEAGHAFTTKAFGREVIGIGVGWYWISPICYVDTSDMWLSGRWPRIAVSLSGAYVNLILAGLTALVGFFAQDPAVAQTCWLLTAASYVMVILNLNPLMEYDGYYALADFLNRPNLSLYSKKSFK